MTGFNGRIAEDIHDYIRRTRYTNMASTPENGFNPGPSPTPDYYPSNNGELLPFMTIMMVFGNAWMREISEKLDELKGDKNNGL